MYVFFLCLSRASTKSNTFEMGSHPTKRTPVHCLDLVLRLHNVSPVCFFYSFKSPSGVICSTKKTVALKVVEIIATAR